jgi:hypothetical protein
MGINIVVWARGSTLCLCRTRPLTSNATEHAFDDVSITRKFKISSHLGYESATPP